MLTQGRHAQKFCTDRNLTCPPIHPRLPNESKITEYTLILEWVENKKNPFISIQNSVPFAYITDFA